MGRDQHRSVVVLDRLPLEAAALREGETYSALEDYHADCRDNFWHIHFSPAVRDTWKVKAGDFLDRFEHRRLTEPASVAPLALFGLQ